MVGWEICLGMKRESRDNTLIDFGALKQFMLAIWNIKQNVIFIVGREKSFKRKKGWGKRWAEKKSVTTQKALLNSSKKKFCEPHNVLEYSRSASNSA